jgi:hypothetical protein
MSERWRHVMSRVLRARAGAGLPPAGEFLPTRCFGSLDDPAQLALEGFISRHPHPGQAPPREPPDLDCAR